MGYELVTVVLWVELPLHTQGPNLQTQLIIFIKRAKSLANTQISSLFLIIENGTNKKHCAHFCNEVLIL